MSQEDNKAAVRRYWEGFNTHNLDVWDEVSTPNFINHDPGLPVPDADLKTIKEVIGGMLAAFPDIDSTEDDLICEGDKIVVRRTFSGTHKGEFFGVPASGNQVTFGGIFISRFSRGQDGRAVGRLRRPWPDAADWGYPLPIGHVGGPSSTDTGAITTARPAAPLPPSDRRCRTPR